MAAPLLAGALIRCAFIRSVLQANRGGTGFDVAALCESRCPSGRIDMSGLVPVPDEPHGDGGERRAWLRGGCARSPTGVPTWMDRGGDDRTDAEANTACDGWMPFAHATGPGSTWNGTLGMLMRRGGGASRVVGVALGPSALSVGISCTRRHGELAVPVLMPGTSSGPGGGAWVSGVSCSRAQPACACPRGERQRMTSSSAWRPFHVEHGGPHFIQQAVDICSRAHLGSRTNRGARNCEHVASMRAHPPCRAVPRGTGRWEAQAVALTGVACSCAVPPAFSVEQEGANSGAR